MSTSLIGMYVGIYIYIHIYTPASEPVPVLRQDIGFFDTHRSGEIMERMSADIQEFKACEGEE